MLRAAFSGCLTGRGTPEDPYKVDWAQESGAVWVDGEEQQTLGPVATASAGLTLGHQQEPLQNVLARARAAEQLAKRSGRDRFALALGRRSSASFSAVGVWRDEAVAPEGVLPVVDRLAQAFRGGHLASGFLYDAVQEADTFEALPFEAARRDPPLPLGPPHREGPRLRGEHAGGRSPRAMERDDGSLAEPPQPWCPDVRLWHAARPRSRARLRRGRKIADHPPPRPCRPPHRQRR